MVENTGSALLDDHSMRRHLLCCAAGLAVAALIGSGSEASAAPRPDPDARLGKLSCQAGEIAKFDGQKWVCAQDETGATGGPGLTTAPFFIVLDGNGAEETIATNGPLEVFARCELGVPMPSVDDAPDATTDIASIVATSTENGWFAYPRAQNGASAGEEVILIQSGEQNSPTGASRFTGPVGFPSGTTAVAPDGSFLSIDGETLGFGLNICGHDCIVAGVVTAFQGDLD